MVMDLKPEVTQHIRINALHGIYEAESGHPGGVLSSVDLIYHLFAKEMNYSVDDFEKLGRDCFNLSRRHCAPALYAVAAEVGILDPAELGGLRKLNHRLQGHTHPK